MRKYVVVGIAAVIISSMTFIADSLSITSAYVDRQTSRSNRGYETPEEPEITVCVTE